MIRNNVNGQFTSESYQSLTTEEKLKISQKQSESWKSRENYIADIVNENPRLYNSWRSIRNTEKGKKAGCCEEWDNYRTFYNDVRPFYEEGKQLVRKNWDNPWSKDNFMYVTSEELGNLRATKVLFYDNEWLSLKDASEKYGSSYSSIKNRYYKHKNDYTVEEIIFGKKHKRNSKPVKDWDEVSSKRSKASKMISSYKLKDKKLGFNEICDIDIDWMLNNIVNKPCIYCGDTSRIGCDRIDNNKGHTKDNVVPCCYDCNCARNNNFTHDEMFELGKTIHNIKMKRNILKIE